MQMGIEFDVVVEFSRLTKPQAIMMARKAAQLVEDAQPHCKHYDNPVVEGEESRGRHYDARRISFFLKAENAEKAAQRIKIVCDSVLNEGLRTNYLEKDVGYSIVMAHAMQPHLEARV